MAGRLEGKRALITGGGKGIGRAIATAFAAEGARCAITSRTLADAEQAAAEIDSKSVLALPCDVKDDASVAAMAAQVRTELGGIDILVNNAGIVVVGGFLDIAPSQFAELFDVNVVGTVRVTQAFLPQMIEQGDGRVINIASTAGLFASLGQSAYNTSKHGVVGLTRCIALEIAAKGVTCNAICPGLVDTGMLVGAANQIGADLDTFRAQLDTSTPMGRILQPDELGPLAVYIASPEASGMTGQTMVISNGMRMA